MCLHASYAGMTVLKDKDVGFLMSRLYQYSYKWEDIGIAFRFLPGELENIRHDHQKVKQCLNAVLCQWVQWPTTAHPKTPTMEMLRDTLRSDLVGLGAVANQLYDARNQLPSQCESPFHVITTDTAHSYDAANQLWKYLPS